MNVSIIIVNYKVKEKLIRCIKSINKSNINSYEIIVVDNEENSGLEKVLKKEFKDVVYIKNDKNLGFGGGNNLGAEYASGKYLFFLNPDTEVFPDTIKHLYNFLEKNRKAGIVSPLLIDKKLIPFKTQSRKELTPKNALFSFSFLRRFFPKKSIYNDEFFDKWDKKHPISVDVVPGAAMMISKKLFQKVGGFDENFFLYFEENDISKRVRNLGFKLYLEPKAKVIHEVGQSTKKIKNAQEIFKRSRFHYFKKHYGFLNAISLELIFAIDKSSLILAIIVLSALFLRIYKIDSLVPFIGDQGWFYISARDLILNKTIPLVGITTSHVWLHQGPLWTYIVATLFSIFKFNPVLPFYFTALFDVLTLILIFKICKEIFSFKTALFSSFLYAFSPIIILNSRTAYHTSLIPFFVILLFYSLYKWMKGDVKYFPFAIFNLFILYNLELQTFLFILLFLAMLFYGYWKKTFWFKKVLNIKIIFYSVIAFLIPMIPVLIYDFNNGFPQTIVFAGWIAYKVYSAIPFLGDGNIGSFINQFFNLKTYFLDFFQKLVFIPNGFFSFTLILLSIAYLIFNNMTSFIKKTYYIQNFLLLYFILFLFLGIILGKTASGAYLMSLFVPVVIMVSVFLNYLSKYKFTFYLILIGLFYIGFVNSVNLVSNNYYVGLDMGYGPSLKERIGISRMFISGSGNNSFSIYARGEGANFESFTMNYRYLTWYYGKEFKKRGGDIIYIVEEFPNQIKFEKIYQNVKRSNTN